MNNKRIRYSQKKDRFIFAVDRSEFPFDPSNRQSRDEALQQLMTHASNVIAALDARAGRELTPRELLAGIAPVEDRTKQEQVAESTAAARSAQPQYFDRETENPFTHGLEIGLGTARKKESRKQMWQRREKEWDEKKAAEAAAQEFASDPKRVRAVAHAEKELLALKYDPSATTSQVKAAERRLEVARSGDLAEYAQLDREWQAAKAAKIDEQAASVDQQIAALRKQKLEIESSTFELPEPPAPAPAPVETAPVETVPAMSWDEYVAGRERTKQFDEALKASQKI